MANKISMPAVSYIGTGALRDAADDICKLGKKALVVTGGSMVNQGHAKILTNLLEAGGVRYDIFLGVTGEPTDKMVAAGRTAYLDANCDFIIGFGGGSQLDAAKAIGAMLTNKRELADYNGGIIENAPPPLAAIPSTAGTGSEATQFTIITDTERDIKMLLKGVALIPRLAIVDPSFTMQAPPSVTAATGLDALTHAIEAYTSRRAFDATDMYTLSAVRRIFRYLPSAYKNGSDREARGQMALAAYEAGVGINNSSVTIVHGMSRPIGALFHVPHGLSNAMLLKVCLEFALDGAYGRFAELGRAVGAASPADGDEAAAKKFLDAVTRICKICDVPTLAGYGIDKEKFFGLIDKMANDAYDSGSPSNTRKSVSVSDMRTLYKKLWE